MRLNQTEGSPLTLEKANQPSEEGNYESPNHWATPKGERFDPLSHLEGGYLSLLISNKYQIINCWGPKSADEVPEMEVVEDEVPEMEVVEDEVPEMDVVEDDGGENKEIQ
ncbi:hypothetical protein KY285_013417 [Solanum tuberosum]|nr:hypothetical protein KY289_014105 [Solanum tuberosum]KAH0717386.1 hypothetical protein KY285_013417 [Solanum tuberosum]